jgi:phosphoribosyl-dephospho-CoA transferase
MSANVERAMLREAMVKASATEDAGRRYCEQLIAASLDVVGASKERDAAEQALRKAVAKLEELVGAP